MAKVKEPEIGAKMYFVREHFYYQKEISAAPFLEYIVCEAEVIDFICGRFTEIHLRGKVEGHGMEPSYYRLQDIGEKIFYTQQEAAARAKLMTEKHETTWGLMDKPMRRSWEKYLETPTLALL